MYDRIKKKAGKNFTGFFSYDLYAAAQKTVSFRTYIYLATFIHDSRKSIYFVHCHLRISKT